MLLPTNIIIGGAAALSSLAYSYWRGINGAAYDVKNAYNTIPTFPKEELKNTAAKADEAIISAASYLYTLKQGVNGWNGVSIAYQAARDSDSTIKFIDGITEQVSGYKLASMFSDRVKVKFVDPASNYLHTKFSDATLDVAYKSATIGAGAVISYATLNPVPLYLAVKDSGAMEANEGAKHLMEVASIAATYAVGGAPAAAANLATHAIKHLTPESSTMQFALPALELTADFAMMSTSWNSGVNKVAKIPLVLTDVARFLSDFDHSADFVFKGGSDWLVNRIPNNNELTFTPAFTAGADIMGGNIVQLFGDNPTAKSVIRDIVKAAPVVWYTVTSTEISNTGIVHGMGNAVSAVLKPACKLAVIGGLTAKYGKSPEEAGRDANYLCEPFSMALALAAKGQQLQPTVFELTNSTSVESGTGLTLLNDKVMYVAKDKEPLAITVKYATSAGIKEELYNKLKTSLKAGDGNIALSFSESDQIWNFVEEHHYPTNEQGLFSYIEDNFASLAGRGLLVGGLKTVASDNLGEAAKGITHFVKHQVVLAAMGGTLPKGEMKEMALPLVKYAALSFVQEVFFTVLLATPIRWVSDGIDNTAKALTAYYSDPNLYKSDFNQECQEIAAWLYNKADEQLHLSGQTNVDAGLVNPT